MPPIRVGFIGLSASRGWARNAHFPYLEASDDFQITAVSNSTLQSAQAAIKEYYLPTETKAYDNFEGTTSPPKIQNFLAQPISISSREVKDIFQLAFPTC
jgi:predicted dehydrogenase